jgi:S1-C subfamily serine protease
MRAGRGDLRWLVLGVLLGAASVRFGPPELQQPSRGLLHEQPAQTVPRSGRGRQEPGTEQEPGPAPPEAAEPLPPDPRVAAPAASYEYTRDPDIPSHLPAEIKAANAATVAIIPHGNDPENPQGHGSGVVVDRSGLIVTNRHVITAFAQDGNGGRVDIRFSGGQVVPATPVRLAARTATDLALLQLGEVPRNLVVASLAQTSELPLGTAVWTIGNPGCGATRTGCGPEQVRLGEVVERPAPRRRPESTGNDLQGSRGPRLHAPRIGLPDAPLPFQAGNSRSYLAQQWPGQTLQLPGTHQATAGGAPPRRSLLYIGDGIDAATRQPVPISESGFSGGGVFTERGELVAISLGGILAFGGEADPASVGMAIRVEDVHDFINGDMATDSLENLMQDPNETSDTR